MTRLFVRHIVKDYAAWRAAFDAHGPARAACGLRDARIFRSVDTPDEVLVILQADDLEHARSFGNDPAVRAAMAAAGVIGDVAVDVTADPLPSADPVAPPL